MSNISPILRHQIIRLAHSHPEFRKDLLPLLTASHKVEAGTYQDYVERKKKQGKPPMKKDEWEARTNGGQQGDSKSKKDESKKDEPKKDEPKKDEPKKEKDVTPTFVDQKLGDLLGQWHSSGSDPLYVVSSNASRGKPVPKHFAEAAIEKLTQMLTSPDEHRIESADVKELKKAKKLLEKALKGVKTACLRTEVIRLAHSHPEFRKDLLPLLQACDHTEGPMMGKYEEDKPADPTENMSPEDKKKWELNTLKYQDKFKQAESEEDDEAKKEASLRSRLIRLAHANPNLRVSILPLLRGKQAGVTPIEDAEKGDTVEVTYKDEKVQGKVIRVKKDGVVTVDLSGKHSNEDVGYVDFRIPKKASGGKISAATAVISKTIKLTVRILSKSEMSFQEGVAPYLAVDGQISIDFGGDVHPDAVRFTATVSSTPNGYIIHAFDPKKTVSGSGAEMLVNVLKAAFQEALDTKGAQILG